MSKIFLFIFCLFPNFNDGKIEIKDNKDVYGINENISFVILNNTKADVYYYVGIDYDNGNQWFELINDVDNPKSRAALIKNIKSGEKIEKSLPVSKIFYKKNFLTFKKFRIKVVYGNSIRALNHNSFSCSFKVIY